MQFYVLPYEVFNPFILYLNTQFVFVNIMFLMASFKSPGNVEKTKDLNFEKLVEKYEA